MVGPPEEAGLVATRKEGRVRTCRLGPSTLDAETAWIAEYRRMVEDRYDRLEEFLERTTRPLGMLPMCQTASIRRSSE
jgi:hypothetical protein